MRFLLLLCLFGLAFSQDYTQQGSWGGDCQTGENQSPINIILDKVAPCDNLEHFKLTSKHEEYTQIAYDQHNGNLKTPFTLSTISIKNVNDNTTKVFNSLQFHFHHTAEHQINGNTYGAELHIVHEANDGSFAVIGYIFRAIRGWFRDPFDKWNLATKKDVQQYFPIPLETPNKVYHYKGSLTIPDCTEGVNWFVNADLIPIKLTSLVKLVELINEGHSNNRNVQPVNQRIVVEAGKVCSVQQKGAHAAVGDQGHHVHGHGKGNHHLTLAQ